MRDIMKRLITILSAAMLLATMIGASIAVPVAAYTCGHGTIVYYDGTNATGARTALCADEYPAANESCSLDQPYCKFTDGTYPDNRISSIDFHAAQAGTHIKVYTGYYFAGSWVIISKPTSGSGIVNVSSYGTMWNNSISSFYSCGQDGCNDNP